MGCLFTLLCERFLIRRDPTQVLTLRDISCVIGVVFMMCCLYHHVQAFALYKLRNCHPFFCIEVSLFSLLMSFSHHFRSLLDPRNPLPFLCSFIHWHTPVFGIRSWRGCFLSWRGCFLCCYSAPFWDVSFLWTLCRVSLHFGFDSFVQYGPSALFCTAAMALLWQWRKLESVERSDKVSNMLLC